MGEIHGNTTGLSPSALKALERVYRRRVPIGQIATPELTRALAEATRLTKRQVGALVHRSGAVEYVMVGSSTGLMLPDIGRLRAAEGRFRALRLIHTHLFNEGLSHDDLVDLTRLRLDLVQAILLAPDGEPQKVTWAYNLPSRDGKSQTPYKIEGPIPYGRDTTNFGELIASLEEEFAKQARTRDVAKEGRAILVHVAQKQRGTNIKSAQRSLQELASLAQTAGVEVCDEVIQLRERIDPKFLLGRGKLEEVVMRAIDLDVETLLFDCALTPTQCSGIASHTDLKVIDRAQLILDIFAQRAESSDGKLQVELAQLRYTLPRLGMRDDALSRLTGGIGGRGPGETKLEIGKRRAQSRVQRLEKQLKQLQRKRSERRRSRKRSGVPTVAIVGYTNAGKSTLLNTLTQAGVLAENKLFATLDTRARQLRLPSGRQIILTDTVGFIRDMPQSLFAAFRATFEESADAHLLLEVVDASAPEFEAHLTTTNDLLEQLGISEMPRLRAFNKVDRLKLAEVQVLEEDSSGVCVSATSKGTTQELLIRLEAELRKIFPETDLEPEWSEEDVNR